MKIMIKLAIQYEENPVGTWSIRNMIKPAGQREKRLAGAPNMKTLIRTARA